MDIWQTYYIYHCEFGPLVYVQSKFQQSYSSLLIIGAEGKETAESTCEHDYSYSAR
jgi:hypothetical protein